MGCKEGEKKANSQGTSDETTDETGGRERSASNLYRVIQRSIKAARDELERMTGLLLMPDPWVNQRKIVQVTERRDACLRLLDLLNKNPLEENAREIESLTLSKGVTDKRKRALARERCETADMLMRTLRAHKFVSCSELAEYLKEQTRPESPFTHV